MSTNRFCEDCAYAQSKGEPYGPPFCVEPSCGTRTPVSARRSNKPVHDASSDDYVAWCRYVNHGQYEDSGADIITIETCDSDAEGAFKVYTRTRLSAEEASAKAVELYRKWLRTSPKAIKGLPPSAKADLVDRITALLTGEG